MYISVSETFNIQPNTVRLTERGLFHRYRLGLHLVFVSICLMYVTENNAHAQMNRDLRPLLGDTQSSNHLKIIHPQSYERDLTYSNLATPSGGQTETWSYRMENLGNLTHDWGYTTHGTKRLRIPVPLTHHDIGSRYQTQTEDAPTVTQPKSTQESDLVPSRMSAENNPSDTVLNTSNQTFDDSQNQNIDLSETNTPQSTDQGLISLQPDIDPADSVSSAPQTQTASPPVAVLRSEEATSESIQVSDTVLSGPNTIPTVDVTPLDPLASPDQETDTNDQNAPAPPAQPTPSVKFSEAPPIPQTNEIALPSKITLKKTSSVNASISPVKMLAETEPTVTAIEAAQTKQKIINGSDSAETSARSERLLQSTIPTNVLPDTLSLDFQSDDAKLDALMVETLVHVADRLSGTNERLQIRAYGITENGQANDSRRLSLSRALAVRAYLIDQGLNSQRIDVRAMGIPDDIRLKNTVTVSLVTIQ